jgi:hypothetical protein
MAKLSPEQINEKLKPLSGWDRKGEAIAKQYTFKTFMDGIGFLNRIAAIAEQMDHHPDVTITGASLWHCRRMTKVVSRRRTSSWRKRSSGSSKRRGKADGRPLSTKRR